MKTTEVKLYRPGKHNIGNLNRLFCLSYGFLFLALSAYLWVGFSVNNFGAFAKFLLIIPLYIGFLGVYQFIFSFCVYNAKKRTYDMR